MWYMATWNVNVDGCIETARQGRDVSVADERKIDQVVSELDIRRWWVHCRRGGK